jgi:hypothetical protein
MRGITDLWAINRALSWGSPMSQLSPVGSFSSSNPLQGVGSAFNLSTSSGVNGGSGTTITEDSLTIVLETTSSGGGSTNSSTPNSTSGTPTSGASNSGSDLFANFLNQIETALQDVLQAFQGNTTGASTTSGSTGTSTTGTSTAGTGTTNTGSTSASGSSNTTEGTNQTGSDSNTSATSGTTSDITIAAITIESIEVTSGGTTSGTTTGTDSSATPATTAASPATNSTPDALQLLERIFSALDSVFQQNGVGSSQTSSAAESPLATFLGQNGLTPGQFSQGVFASLQQNGGTAFSLADIFQNASSGQNLNALA